MAQPSITQAAAIKIVTVITPSQSENGQISLTQSPHGKVPHTSPARSPSPPPTLKALDGFMVLGYISYYPKLTHSGLQIQENDEDENYSCCCDLCTNCCLQNLSWK